MSEREVERGSGVAVWRQIGEALADDIRKKLYGPGEQLPPESELAMRFAVNRHTVRRAMSELEQSGLVRIEQGRGTFVQEHAIDYAIARRTRFSQNLAAQGMRGHTEVVGSQVSRLPEVARHLGLARTAPVLHVQMVARPRAVRSMWPSTISITSASRSWRTCCATSARFRGRSRNAASPTTLASGRASRRRCPAHRWRGC